MSEKYSLLLVDDEPWALSGLEEIIDWEAEGFRIVARCSCGQEAIRAALRFHPDAVITDVRMPDMSGLQLIGKLRELVPDLPCALVSAYSDFDVAREAIRLSALHYILKPFSADEVREAAGMLREKLQTMEKKEPLSVLHIDPTNPVFSVDLEGSCYLLLSDVEIFLPELPGEHRSFVQIGDYLGILTDCTPTSLPPEVGCSMKAPDCTDAARMLRTAQASLMGGFRYVDGTVCGKSQLSIADVQFYLAEHMGQDIALKDLAGKFYLTETYLCDLFKKQTGETILGFLKRIRMHYAKRLLSGTRMNLREIAFACGYSDYSYFGRHFKAEVGVTPDLYRKQQQNR